MSQVMVKMELCSVGDLVEKHSLSAALSHQYCQDILSNHVKLINLEEIQTKIDIAQYDMHHVKLAAVPKNKSNTLPTTTTHATHTSAHLTHSYSSQPSRSRAVAKIAPKWA